MYPESDLLPLSALQHLLFCERQCALIHVEQVWAENRLTVEGQLLHRRAHDGADEWRDDVRIVRGLPIRSFRLGLIGKTDVVELQRLEQGVADLGIPAMMRVPLPQLCHEIQADPRHWRITPVEYKRGSPKKDDSDRVQLCAQALCLEEMLHVQIERGDLYYGRQRRRTTVRFDNDLRNKTQQAAQRLHQLFSSHQTPRVERQPKCNSCSLLSICLPDAARPGRSAAKFIDRQFAAVMAANGPATDGFDGPEATP